MSEASLTMESIEQLHALFGDLDCNVNTIQKAFGVTVFSRGSDVKITGADENSADAVKIPVIAAGGIADGRGMAAAFMLGAEAVQMGTRFVASKEAVVHENYKQLVIKAKDIDTRVTGRTTGHPVRAIRNEMTRHYLELEKEGAPFEELEKLTLGGLRRAVVDGDVKTGSVMSGQIAGMVKDEKSCKEIIEQMMNEMEELLKGAPARL